MVEWKVFLDFKAALDKKKEDNSSYSDCTFRPQKKQNMCFDGVDIKCWYLLEANKRKVWWTKWYEANLPHYEVRVQMAASH
jgi:hypothetical protein